MKRIIILMIVLFFVLLHIDTSALVAKHIDLRLKENEMSIVFIRLQNSKSLLINDLKTSNLFILDYKNDEGIKNALNVFDSHPDIFFLKHSVEKKVDSIYVTKRDGIFKVRVNNYTLCIYDNDGGNLKTCDFVYLMNLNKSFTIDENINTIFYDDDIDKKLLLEVQESWIDNHIVGTDSFTILKLSEESYNVVVVPSTKG
ncbi:MAG: hypothetical protein HFH47_03020 [Bacilli bacterium]|nr:hypothetical protein [Bacilli bacterium]